MLARQRVACLSFAHVEARNSITVYDGDGSGIHERRQLSHRAHKTISPCRELASARHRRRRQLAGCRSADTDYWQTSWASPERPSTVR